MDSTLTTAGSCESTTRIVELLCVEGGATRLLELGCSARAETLFWERIQRVRAVEVGQAQSVLLRLRRQGKDGTWMRELVGEPSGVAELTSPRRT